MNPRAAREFVGQRADSRCEYCRAPQIVTGANYHVEHIIPRALGGADDAANYALACITCNGHKAAHLTGIDQETSGEVPLFDPRGIAGRSIFDSSPLRSKSADLRPKAAQQSRDFR